MIVPPERQQSRIPGQRTNVHASHCPISHWAQDPGRTMNAPCCQCRHPTGRTVEDGLREYREFKDPRGSGDPRRAYNPVAPLIELERILEEFKAGIRTGQPLLDCALGRIVLLEGEKECRT